MDICIYIDLRRPYNPRSYQEFSFLKSLKAFFFFLATNSSDESDYGVCLCPQVIQLLSIKGTAILQGDKKTLRVQKNLKENHE
jgi:hypothetical protein